MAFSRTALSFAIAAQCLLAASPALSQRTIERTYDGGYRSTDDDGYSVTGRRTYDGYKTSDNDGNSVTTRRTYNGYKRTDGNGNSVTCRPIYNGGVKCEGK